MDQFLDPETDANCQFLVPETDKNDQFLDKNLLDPETDVIEQFLGLETHVKHQFLEQDTDIKRQQLTYICVELLIRLKRVMNMWLFIISYESVVECIIHGMSNLIC